MTIYHEASNLLHEIYKYPLPKQERRGPSVMRETKKGRKKREKGFGYSSPTPYHQVTKLSSSDISLTTCGGNKVIVNG